MKRPLGKIAAFFVLALAAGAATRAQTPTLTVLYSFKGSPDGNGPYLAALILDKTGNLYGTTNAGGTGTCSLGRIGPGPGCGTVFKVDTSGNETVLHSFTGSDGAGPASVLIMDAAGNLYGTTSSGGSVGAGTVFKIDTSGNETVLHSFASFAVIDGEGPDAGLIMDNGGSLYGTTSSGGSAGVGTVFKIDNSGNETVLYSFKGGKDGARPEAGLIMDQAGNLYGTTLLGGAFGNGTVFKLDTSGNETVLHSFTGSDGAFPSAGVIMDKAGNLYGTTFPGGAFGPGTVFKLDASGHETVLHSFNIADGSTPAASLIMDAAGNLYGTTIYGGVSNNCSGGCGTVFKLTPVSTPPTITVSFPVPPSGQDGFFKAGQTPVVGSVSASDPSNVTAISCSDSLSALTTGALTGGGTTSASESLSVNGDGIHAISCTATDGAGNSDAAPGSVNTATIEIDTTPPTITFSGNRGKYAVNQTVNITTTAADALSGMAFLFTQPLPNSFVLCAPGTLCANFTAPAYSLGPGIHTISATATDRAGNAASSSTSFTVIVTYASQINLVNLFDTNPGVASAMVATLQAAAASAAAGNKNAADGQLGAFINQVSAQSGKTLSPAQATILIQLAEALM